MTTVRKLLTGTLRLLGAIQSGEDPSSDDMAISLEAFNAMIDSWSNNSLTIYRNQPNYFSITPGVSTYAIGPGMTWNTLRPMRIDECYVSNTPIVNGEYVRTKSTIEWPVSIVNEKQWADIPIKGVQGGIPSAMFSDGDAPASKLSFYPVPTTAMTAVLWSWQPFNTYPTLNDTIAMPPGYERALRFNLAIELASEFGKTVDPQIIAIANESLDLIARVNSEPQIMSLDNAVLNKPMFSWVTGDTTRRP